MTIPSARCPKYFLVIINDLAPKNPPLPAGAPNGCVNLAAVGIRPHPGGGSGGPGVLYGNEIVRKCWSTTGPERGGNLPHKLFLIYCSYFPVGNLL